MEEVKINESFDKENFIEEKPLLEMVNDIHKALENKKTKRIKIPRKARVKKRKLKKGWVGALIIQENGNIHGERVKIEGSCFTEKAGTYHATDKREIIHYEGKYPILVQPTWRINPINFSKDISSKNETYGQEYIKAKMLADVIKVKKKSASIIIWIIVGVAVLVGINYFMKGGAI